MAHTQKQQSTKMDSSVIEDLKLEVIGTLYTLTREALLEICSGLDIKELRQLDVSKQTRSFFIAHIGQYLNRDEVHELEDEGMTELLMLKDKISELQESAQANIPNQTGSGEAQTEIQEQASQVSEEQRLKRELEAVTLALKLSLQKDGSQEPERAGGASASQDQVFTPQRMPQGRFPSQWCREFKISGQVGEPGQKDKLSFSSLAHQIEQGINKGYTEVEIVDSVVRAIAPGLQLRSYLEGKADLTLPTLRRILRFHYQEKGATELYKQLTSEVQGSKESPQNFVIRALDLRQKIIFASQEAESALRYDPVLVQSMFLHTVLTGLQNESIRNDVLPYLQQQTCSDELLLEKLNIACANETERQNKRRQITQQRSATVHAAQSDDSILERKNKEPNRDNPGKTQPDVLNELKAMRSDMALLKTLSAEVAQIKESIRQPSPMPVQTPSPPVMQEYIPAPQFQQPSPNRWPPPGPGVRGHTAPYQQGFARQHYYNPSPRVRQRKCVGCQQNSVEYCTHCYRCGSEGHYLAGCRFRETRPERHLNDQRLPPRDRE